MKYIIQRNAAIVVVLAMLFFVGCPMQQMKSITDMTPKEKAAWMWGTYNSQYRDYQAMLGYVKEDGKWVRRFNPVLTDDQKKILVKKKEILSKVHPLLKMYSGYIDSGTAPDRQTEDKIIGLINALMAF